MDARTDRLTDARTAELRWAKNDHLWSLHHNLFITLLLTSTTITTFAKQKCIDYKEKRSFFYIIYTFLFAYITFGSTFKLSHPKLSYNEPSYKELPVNWDRQAWSNSVYPDQMYNAATDRGLHGLPFIQQFLDTSSGSKTNLFKL